MANIVCLHGLGGTGATLEPLAMLLRAAGHEVVCPTLPGHGTRPEDLDGIDWSTWLDAVPAGEVLIGQSMGGSLVLDLAARRMDDVRAVVCINALAPDPDAVDGLEWRRDRGHHWVEGAPAVPGELAYDRLPIGALLAMVTGIAAIDLSGVRCPVLVVLGALDDAVDPGNSDVIAASVPGPVERCTLVRSGHVAVLGDELDTLAAAILDFVGRRCTS